MHSKFVILALPRTGSNMLVSLLDTHSKIFCKGELFKRELVLSKNTRDSILNIDKQYYDLNYRFKNRMQYVNDVFSLATRGNEMFGFKLMLNQSIEFAIELVENLEWKIIYLERDNILASFSSHEIAKVTGQGSARLKDEVIQTKIPFNKIKFERFMARRERLTTKIWKYLDKRKTMCLFLKYSTLSSPETFRTIQEFLGLEIEDIQPQTRKRSSSLICSRFENEIEVKDFLITQGLSDWLRE